MPRRYFRLRERSHFQSKWNEMRRGAAQIDMHSLALLCGTCESPLAESNLIWFGANHIIASLLANWPLGDLLLERWRGCLCTDADISGLRWGDCEEVNGKHFRRRHYSIQHTYSPPMRHSPPSHTPMLNREHQGSDKESNKYSKKQRLKVGCPNIKGELGKLIFLCFRAPQASLWIICALFN